MQEFFKGLEIMMFLRNNQSLLPQRNGAIVFPPTEMLYNATVGERIKWFRNMRGITQKALAELTGIHPVSVRKYETNKMLPSLPQLKQLAVALNVNIILLIGFD